MARWAPLPYSTFCVPATGPRNGESEEKALPKGWFRLGSDVHRSGQADRDGVRNCLTVLLLRHAIDLLVVSILFSFVLLSFIVSIF
jgi:hypothetical protein